MVSSPLPKGHKRHFEMMACASLDDSGKPIRPKPPKLRPGFVHAGTTSAKAKELQERSIGF